MLSGGCGGGGSASQSSFKYLQSEREVLSGWHYKVSENNMWCDY